MIDIYKFWGKGFILKLTDVMLSKYFCFELNNREMYLVFLGFDCILFLRRILRFR